MTYDGTKKQNRESRSNFNGGANAKEKQNIKDHHWLL